MLKTYLLTAWQHLARQKLFALINVLGLGIGLAVFILIFLYVEKEYSWDRQWDDADRIYWLTLERRMNALNRNKNPFVPSAMNDVIAQNFPDAIEKSAQLAFRGGDIYVEDQRYPGNIMFAGKSFLDIFDLEATSGSLADTFSGPGRVALREEMARQYFGEQDPLGKTISLQMGEQNRTDFLVTAVFRVPEETSVFLGSLSLLDDADQGGQEANAGGWWNSGFGVNYFVLREGVDIDAMNRRLVDLVNTVVPKEPWRIMRPDENLSDYYTFEFESLTGAHFSDYLGTNNVDRNKVLVFALIGVLVLLMGSANFINLATAKAEDRRKEVGVRKVLGATRRQLVFQFLIESVLQTCVALGVAVVFVAMTLQVFGNLVGRELDFSPVSGATAVYLVFLAVCVGLLGGLYPALVLSSFSPVRVFKTSGRVFMPGYLNIRNAMVCFQFIIAIALMVATLGVYFQLNHLRQLDPGFTTDRLFSVAINFQERRLMEPYLNAVAALPGVEATSKSSRRPGPGGAGILISGNYQYGPDNNRSSWSGIWVDHAFFDVYDIDVLAGRVFSPEVDRLPDPGLTAEERREFRSKIVINNTYARSLGFATPEAAVGERVVNEARIQDGEILRTPIEIIGVVQDSRFNSLRELPESTVYMLTPDYTTLTVRYNDSVAETIAQDLEQTWMAVAPDSPFRGEFVSTVLADEFRQEENEGRLMLSLALLSLFIAGMGMFALASYTLKRSVKEIGIRKVMGANFRSILLLFAGRFSLPVLVASLIALPVALYMLLRWLQRFPDQISYEILGSLSLLGILLSVLIAWAAVGLTTVRAARANPVKSLRYE